jgi:hypothetical protein
MSETDRVGMGLLPEGCDVHIYTFTNKCGSVYVAPGSVYVAPMWHPCMRMALMFNPHHPNG